MHLVENSYLVFQKAEKRHSDLQKSLGSGQKPQLELPMHLVENSLLVFEKVQQRHSDLQKSLGSGQEP